MEWVTNVRSAIYDNFVIHFKVVIIDICSLDDLTFKSLNELINDDFIIRFVEEEVEQTL